jgi:leucyl aminopeptidase
MNRRSGFFRGERRAMPRSRRMSLSFSLTEAGPSSTDADAIVVGVYEDKTLTAAAAEVDHAAGGALQRLVDSGDVSGKTGSVSRLLALPGVSSPRVFTVGLGEAKRFDAARFLRVNAEAVRAVKGTPARNAANYLVELDVPEHDLTWKLRQAALTADAQLYRYASTFKAQPEPTTLAALAFRASGDAAALAHAAAIAAGVRFARELGNLPPNVCNPEYLATQARRFAEEEANVTIEVLERAQMEALGMGALLAVARGSANAPRLIVLQYRGADAGAKPYALVGKGITFDSGGISIKPGPGMEEMRFDMMGAATVLGAFLAVARLRLAINVVCIVPAVENMPDGDAYRPGDVLTSLSGQTIEVANTDAEGRLILCDALTYVHGLMTRHDDLAGELLRAGETAMDRAWRLPLWDDYQAQLDSAFADMANVGGKSAGAITAGCFLARFTEGQRWAHLDIAGTAWNEGRKGQATGRPVPLLVQWLVDRAAG